MPFRSNIKGTEAIFGTRLLTVGHICFDPLYVSIFLKNDETWNIDFNRKKIHHLSLSQTIPGPTNILTTSSRLFDHSGRPASENGNDAEDDAPRKRQIDRRKMSGSPMVLEVVSMYLISLISLKCRYTTSKLGIRWNYSVCIVQCDRFKRLSMDSVWNDSPMKSLSTSSHT